MWNILKPSSSRTLRRHERGREIPRSGIESLERRECPTVVFGLESGVLSITGDDRANVIEVSEPREGLVLVVGDGVRRTFRGVNQIVIDAKGGDDEIATSSDSFFGVGIYKINAGAGNDRITIGDGVRVPVINLPVLTTKIQKELRVDLGPGADNLRVALNNSHNVGLDVLSADGGDVIEVGILFSVCQHPDYPSTVCGLRASFQLGGGDNDLDLRTEGSGNVDLELVAAGGGNSVKFVGPETGGGNGGYIDEDLPPWCEIDLNFAGGGNQVDLNTEGDFFDIYYRIDAVGGGNTVKINQGRILVDNDDGIWTSRANLMLTGDGNSVSFNTHGYDQVDLDLDLTGNSNGVVIGLLLPAVQKCPPECYARVNLDLDGVGNIVSVNSDGFENTDLDLTSGGESKILIGMLLPAVQKVREAAARIDVNVGADSFVDVSLENIDNVDLNIVSEPATPQSATGGGWYEWRFIWTAGFAGSRDGEVLMMFEHISVLDESGGPRSVGVTPNSLSFSGRAGDAHTAPSMNATIKTGAADDTVSILTRCAGDLNLAVDTGGGNDNVTILHKPQPWYEGTLDPINHHIFIVTGEGDDSVVVDANAGRIGGLAVDPRNRDTLFDINLDLGAGNDLADIRIEGFSKASLNLTAGEGDDDVLVKVKPMFAFIVVDLDGARLNVDLGAGNDVLDSDIRGFSNASARIDAGAGNDSIRHKMFSIVDRTNVKVDRARFDFFAELGEGSDTLLLETLGGREIRTVIDTGPPGDGRDRISASHQSLRHSGPVQRRHLAFDQGMDVYELLAVGYTVQINMTSPTRQFTLIQDL